MKSYFYDRMKIGARWHEVLYVTRMNQKSNWRRNFKLAPNVCWNHILELLTQKWRRMKTQVFDPQLHLCFLTRTHEKFPSIPNMTEVQTTLENRIFIRKLILVISSSFPFSPYLNQLNLKITIMFDVYYYFIVKLSKLYKEYQNQNCSTFKCEIGDFQINTIIDRIRKKNK